MHADTVTWQTQDAHMMQTLYICGIQGHALKCLVKVHRVQGSSSTVDPKEEAIPVPEQAHLHNVCSLQLRKKLLPTFPPSPLLPPSHTHTDEALLLSVTIYYSTNTRDIPHQSSESISYHWAPQQPSTWPGTSLHLEACCTPLGRGPSSSLAHQSSPGDSHVYYIYLGGGHVCVFGKICENNMIP